MKFIAGIVLAALFFIVIFVDHSIFWRICLVAGMVAFCTWDIIEGNKTTS